jgi:very-short-patch-repair endonuclease
MSVTYSPPYDSPIEDAFAYHFAKYANENVQFDCQVPVQTICGLFVIDFVAHAPNIGRIAIECDGKDFHDESRDEWRDAMILGAKAVDTIYRVRGSDIAHHIDDILFCLSRLEPGIASKRGEINLNALASYEVKELSLNQDHDLYHLYYKDEEQEGALLLEIRRQRIPVGQRRFWQSAYRHAVSVGGGDLDEVIRGFRQCI